MKTALFVIMTLMIAGIAIASPCDTPDKTAKAYIQYDLEGARLGRDVSGNIDKFVTNNRYEPGWDIATLVTGYKIKSVKKKGQKAVVKILFKNSWETATTFTPESIKDEIIEMHLIKEKGCWRVGPPFYMPHLYPESLASHLEKLIESDAETAGREWLEYTQAELNCIRQYSKTQAPLLVRE